MAYTDKVLVPLEEGARKDDPILMVHPNYDDESTDRSKPSQAFEILEESSYELQLEDSPETPLRNCPDCNKKYTGTYITHLTHCKGLSSESLSDTENVSDQTNENGNQISGVKQNSRRERDCGMSLGSEQTNNDMDPEIVGGFQQHQSPKPMTTCRNCNEKYTAGTYLIHLSHCKGLSSESSSTEEISTENNRATKLTFAQTQEIENERADLRWRTEEQDSEDPIPNIDPHVNHNLEKRRLVAARPPGLKPTPHVIKVI